MPGSRDELIRIQHLVLWVLTAVVAIVGFFLVPRTAWHETLLPLPSRLGLLALELLALGFVSLLLAVPLSLYARGDVDRRSRSGWVLRVLILLVAWLAATAYLTSWGVFHATGRFLDTVTVRLLAANAVQMVQHALEMDPVWTVAMPVLGLLLAIVGLAVPPRLAQLSGHKAARRASLIALLLMLGLGVAGLVGSRYAFSQTYRQGGLARTGPLTGAANDIAARLTYRSDPMWDAAAVSLEQRPIVSMSEFLAKAGSTTGPRWNVVIVVVESLRNDQLLATGGEREVMSTVDSIAKNARVFTRNYTQSSHSDYADPAILSSHYPLRSRTYHIYPRNPTYPRVLIYDVLKPLGYRVGVFSSQNEHWSGMINYLQTGNIDRFLHAENYEGPTYVPSGDPYFARWVRGSKRSGKIDDRYTVAEAIDWIESTDDRPFFLYMNLQKSHVPYDLPADFPPRFGSGRVSFPLQFGYFPPDSVDAVKDLYANSLAYVDAQITRLVEHLQQTGDWDRTVFVVTGDTGQAFFEHGFAGHANALYDEVMRVPLIIRAPGLAPRTEGAVSQHIDIPPSVLGLLGLPKHPSLQGRDLFETDGAGEREERDAFLTVQAAAQQYGIVSRQYKLIFDAMRNDYLLFDLDGDPGETTDLSEELTGVTSRLARRLHAWRRAHIEYYSDWRLHQEWYPPILPDSI